MLNRVFQSLLHKSIRLAVIAIVAHENLRDFLVVVLGHRSAPNLIEDQYISLSRLTTSNANQPAASASQSLPASARETTSPRTYNRFASIASRRARRARSQPSTPNLEASEVASCA